MKTRLYAVFGSLLIGLLIGISIIIRADIRSSPPVVTMPPVTPGVMSGQTWYIRSDEPIAAYDCPNIDCSVAATLTGGMSVTVIGSVQGEALFPVIYRNQVVYILDSWLSPQLSAIEVPGIAPKGATAICIDGWISFAKHRRGTCSHHIGVGKWVASVPP